MTGPARRRWVWLIGLLASVPLLIPQAGQAAFAGSTVLVSRPSGLGPVPPAFDNTSTTPGGLSANGRYAVYESDADGFAPGSNPKVTNILLRDRHTNTTTLVSRSDGITGTGANRDSSDPAIAVDPANGHVLVAFATSATNLVDHASGQKISVPGEPDEVWLRDVTAGTTTLVSRADGASGAPASNSAGSPALDIAPGGPVIAFQSFATNLGVSVGGIFLRSVASGGTELVSCANSSCSQHTGVAAYDPAVRVSNSGQTVEVAFDTNDVSLTGDTAGQHFQIVYTSMSAPQSSAASAATPSFFFVESPASNGSGDGNDDSTDPSFDSDGQAIAFISRATNLTTDTLPASPEEAYIRTFSGPATILVSRATGSAGNPSTGNVRSVSLGGDSTHLRAVFDASSGNLTTFGDALVRDVAGNVTTDLNRQAGDQGFPGNAGSGGSSAISADGNAALFQSYATNLGDYSGTAPFGRVHLRTLPSNDVGGGAVVLISRPSGTRAFASLTRSSQILPGGAISADGRYVVFSSTSPSLSSAINSRFQYVYVRDLLRNRTILVSRATGATGAVADNGSGSGAISADGSMVVFASSADNLGGGAPNGVAEVYVRNLHTNTTTLVSRATGPHGAPAASLALPVGFSANGNAVLMQSASPLSPAGAGGQYHLYLRKLSTNTTQLVDRDNGAAGSPTSGGNFDGEAIDANGGRIVFASTAALAGAPNDGKQHVYLRDIAAGTTTLVSRADGASGASADRDSIEPAIDAGGDTVAFVSYAQNLGTTFVNSQVFLRRLNTDDTLLVSSTSGGLPAAAGDPSLDARGDRIAFQAYGLPGGPTKALQQVYVRDLTSGAVSLISRANGAQGAAADGTLTFAVSLSANGNCAAFQSNSMNLADGFASFDFPSIHMRVLRRECPIAPPNTVITNGPSGSTTNSRPKFTFKASEPVVTFQCRTDGKPFRSCHSPIQVGPLPTGRHTFAVRAIDRAHYADPTPAVRSFQVVRR